MKAPSTLHEYHEIFSPLCVLSLTLPLFLSPSSVLPVSGLGIALDSMRYWEMPKGERICKLSNVWRNVQQIKRNAFDKWIQWMGASRGSFHACDIKLWEWNVYACGFTCCQDDHSSWTRITRLLMSANSSATHGRPFGATSSIIFHVFSEYECR